MLDKTPLRAVEKGMPKGKNTFELLSIKDLEALGDPEWLINSILTVDSQAVLFGPPGEGKSFVALSFALCVATGRKWMGREVKQGPVIYIAAEGGRGLRKRVGAFQKEHGVEDIDSVFFIIEAPQLRSQDDVKKLIQTLKQHMPVLVGVDTFARTMVGGDENTAKDVGEWVDNAKRIQEATKACVLTLHHTVKAKKNGRLTERGSGALRGAADTMLAVSKDYETVTLACEKQKDDEEFADIPLTLKRVELEPGPNGPQSSLVVVEGGVNKPRAAKRLSEPAQAILGLLCGLGAESVKKRDWKNAVDAEWKEEVPTRTFDNWIDELVNAGAVERVSRGVYSVTQAGHASATDMPSAAIREAA